LGARRTSDLDSNVTAVLLVGGDSDLGDVVAVVAAALGVVGSSSSLSNGPTALLVDSHDPSLQPRDD